MARAEHLLHHVVEMLLRLVRVHDLPRARALPEHHRRDPWPGTRFPDLVVMVNVNDTSAAAASGASTIVRTSPLARVSRAAIAP